MYYDYRHYHMLSEMPHKPMPEPVTCQGGRIYIVRPGDTMYKIAIRYGISLQQLIDANPQIKDPSFIMVGQRICIPSKDDDPVEKDICTIILNANIEGVLGGAAFIDIKNNDKIWVTTVGLPAPNTIDKECTRYVAWIIKRDKKDYCKIELETTGVIGVEAGYIETKVNIEDYKKVIVTAESTPSPDKPCGKIVLKSNGFKCK